MPECCAEGAVYRRHRYFNPVASIQFCYAKSLSDPFQEHRLTINRFKISEFCQFANQRSIVRCSLFERDLSREKKRQGWERLCGYRHPGAIFCNLKGIITKKSMFYVNGNKIFYDERNLDFQKNYLFLFV